MADKKEKSITNVATGLVRLSFARVWEKSKMDDDSKEKYSCVLLIRKDDAFTLDQVNAAIEFLKADAKKKLGGKLPSKFDVALRDGDVEKPTDDAFSGCYYLNAKSERRPGIVKRVGDKVIDIKEEDKDEVYSGCYCRAGINFYLFGVPDASKTKGNRGIGVGLNNLLKVKDGEPLAGGRSAEEDFSDDFEYEEQTENEDDFLN